MATILLQAAGAYLGGMLGPVGSAIGTAAGALAGFAADSALLNGTRRIEGLRLAGARPFSAEEGMALTTLRDDGGAFPFVEQLCALAADVRLVLGPSARLTYGADWSEYFGYHPADGSGDVLFHLDPLWSHPAIDAVGIDNYMPLSDWRDVDYAGGNPDGFAGPYDPAGLRAGINGGEGFDWYYPSLEARDARAREPISDGAYGKPWTYRYKDIVSWWSNPHFDRIGGVEQGAPTGWVPSSKPVWFTELGCPAVDKGPNQPNVFPDPKSAEDAAPYFSSKGRADDAQRRFLAAHMEHWNPDAPGFDEAANPMSPVYGGRMLDVSRIYLWAWDARPFPAFPLRGDLWSDGDSWDRGHWLNGRLANPDLGSLINAILIDHGHPPADVDGADGTVHGYALEDPTSARAALEPLLDLYGIAVIEEPDGLVFRQAEAASQTAVDLTEFISTDDGPVVETSRSPDHDLPVEAILTFRDPMADHQAATVRRVRLGAAGRRQHAMSFPGVLEKEQGAALLDAWLKRTWYQRETLSFSVVQPKTDIVPGSIVRVRASGSSSEFLVTGIEDGLVRKVSARQIVRGAPVPPATAAPHQNSGSAAPDIAVGRPHALFLDLPAEAGSGALSDQFRVAAWQKPWRSQAVFVSPEATGFSARTTISRPAALGRLIQPLGRGFEGRVDKRASILVELFDVQVESISRLRLLNGANAAALRSVSGVWEVLQFETAQEVAPQIWKLGTLLRGQLGTRDAMEAGAAAGADFVMLDDAVVPAGLQLAEIGLALNWRVGTSELSGGDFAGSTQTGGLRAALPYAPVHLRGRWEGDQMVLSWIRRSRIGGDSWEADDVPLGEEVERYQIEIAPPGGAVLRTATAAQPLWPYPKAVIASDFGSLPAAIEVTVRQLGSNGWGIPASRCLDLS